MCEEILKTHMARDLETRVVETAKETATETATETAKETAKCTAHIKMQTAQHI